MKKEKKKLHPSGELFFLKNKSRRIGESDTEYLSKMNHSIMRIESAIQALNLKQCPNCEEPIPPGTKEALGGICWDCWLEDPDMDDRIDFQSLTDREIYRHWWEIDLHDAMYHGEHRKQDLKTIQYAMHIECFLGYDRILKAVSSIRGFHGKPIESITSTESIRWDSQKKVYYWKA